ncbi:alternative ribosome rescue factor ArfA, partial [Neisseria gonorrhoeae]
MGGKAQHNKGKIRDNALKALVKSDLFRHKVERKRKGKGSYNRQEAKKRR